MNAMNILSQSLPNSMPPAVFAMLSYTSQLLLTETSAATAKRDSAHTTSDHLVPRAAAITITVKRGEGYAHYGIND